MLLPLAPPTRVAFSAREVARPGEIWRLFQEVALAGSAAGGWTPQRYLAERCAFVMRSMRVVHERELAYGEGVSASTCIARIRRDTFFTRDSAVQDARGVVARTRQEWAVVSYDLAAMRAPRELLEAFPPESSPEVSMPEIEPRAEVALAPLEIDALFCFTDPLDHVNHTVHVDWCDGAIARALARGGIAARELVPVAEEATFRAGIVVGDRVRVESSLVGATAAGALAFTHRVFAGEVLAASLTTVRTLVGEDGAERMARALGGSSSGGGLPSRSSEG